MSNSDLNMKSHSNHDVERNGADDCNEREEDHAELTVLAVPCLTPFERVEYQVADLFGPGKFGGEDGDADQKERDTTRSGQPAGEPCQDDKKEPQDKGGRLADNARNCLPLLLDLDLHVISIALVASKE